MVAFTLTNHKEGFKKLLSLGEAIRFHCFNTGIFDAFWGRGPRCSDMLSHSPQITTCISYHHPLHSNSVPKKKKMSWKKWILSVHFSSSVLFLHNTFSNSSHFFFCLSSFFWNGKTLCHFIRLNIVKWITRWGNVSHYDSEEVIAMCTVGGAIWFS